MTSFDKIKELNDLIESEHRKISGCRPYRYGKPYYDPITVKEACGFRTVNHGSDIWSEPTGYRDVQIDRWT